MNDILRYRGLYGDHQIPFVPDFIHVEPLQERSKIFDWEIKEHFHTDLIQLFIIESSHGLVLSDGQQIQLQAPCLVTIPSNVLHGFQFEPEITGSVITLSTSLFASLFKDNSYLNENTNLSYTSFDETQELFEEINYLKSKIQREIVIEAPEKITAIKYYLGLIYLQIHRKKFRNISNELVLNNKSLNYYQQFQDLIRTNAQNQLSIKEFAKKIGITQTHLNRICKKVADKSALKVVQDFMLNEAKKYLLNSSYSVSEVAFFLNFNDPAYFNRLFKKRVGVSPGEFRKMN
jgi:AraC family transcriptional activator of pobA